MKFIPHRLEQPIVRAIRSMSLTTKAFFVFFVVVFIVSVLWMLYSLQTQYVVEIPHRGGSLTIGIIGTPRLINPVIAQTEAGKDIANLVYAGLLKKDASGGITPDMAEAFVIASSGKEITFTLKKDLTFHDGTPVTTEDIAFTIAKIQDAALKSPRRPYWEHIKTTIISPTEITLTSTKTISDMFREFTVGILPAHIWKHIDNDEFSITEQNLEPIGSGPYMVNSVTRQSTGVPTSYRLTSFKNYTGGAPYIRSLHINIYQNDVTAMTALKNGTIDTLGGLPANALTSSFPSHTRIETRDLPRVFAVFFNQNQSPILADSAVRKALMLTAPRDQIVADVFHGAAQPIFGPLPMFLAGTSTPITDPESAFTEAQKILDKAGWTMGTNGMRSKKVGKDTTPLAFSIATSEIPDLKEVAQVLKETWGRLGVEITINVYEAGDLNQNIIRQRHYDALLFGQIIAQGRDLYAFWHSSQRNNPGLNVAQYANSKVDKILDTMRTSGTTDISTLYESLRVEFDKDIPAVFLYSPQYIEVVPASLQGYRHTALQDPSERFIGAHAWYLDTEYVWKWFAPKNNTQ